MSELTILRKRVKEQDATIQEQEVTIVAQQAEITRIKARFVSKRRTNRKNAAHG